MQTSNCRFHASVPAAGTCPKCRRPVCSFCLPIADKPCRACIGYRHSQTIAAAAALSVSLFLGFISPLFGLVGIVVLFFAFRALFRRRTETILRNARPIDASTDSTGGTSRHYCNDCHLWSDGTCCSQCGRSLV